MHRSRKVNWRKTQQDAYLREIEVDPHAYYPEDVDREIVTALPDEITIDLRPMKEQMRRKMGG